MHDGHYAGNDYSSADKARKVWKVGYPDPRSVGMDGPTKYIFDSGPFIWEQAQQRAELCRMSGIPTADVFLDVPLVHRLLTDGQTDIEFTP